ncbi:MAG: HpcH/HpaI aldolase/citrate lyase family protein [Rhodobacteraceae bacterium]|nr:HpcH/HpaI aldolase/citrate lyase family protein [Paracoccaceae bacterium]MCF8516168.1 HpcH/HpaI aldolase/citrate lyase family protein [Paracoccaceae bacterium]MCF8520439.1 HpcH/HpaI aldolase/citrate lyase family protein [Paracoccaceae bacterium]
MTLPRNEFLAAIRAGRPQIGIWVSLASNFAAEVVAGAGFDWALLDMEHAPNEMTLVLGQLQAFAPYPTTALVRPDWNDAVKVKRILDMGAPGLLFPMVQTVEEARAAVAAMRYPPRGVRGVSVSTRANGFGRIPDYFARVEAETATLVQLETRAAIALADQIGAVDGVDGVFFGPADIAADLGHMGQPMHADVWALVRPVAQRLIAAGVPVGTLVPDPAFARQLLAEGFTFVACGSDLGLLARGADHLLRTMKA